MTERTHIYTTFKYIYHDKYILGRSSTIAVINVAPTVTFIARFVNNTVRMYHAPSQQKHGIQRLRTMQATTLPPFRIGEFPLSIFKRQKRTHDTPRVINQVVLFGRC
jgi:hypothetical protein